ncbi:MAG: hypothetical protein U0P28_04420, partial [Ruminococcus sp.]
INDIKNNSYIKHAVYRDPKTRRLSSFPLKKTSKKADCVQPQAAPLNYTKYSFCIIVPIKNYSSPFL